MRLNLLKDRAGQGVAAEYAILFFIVVAVIVSMTTYIKRTLQGRIHDARNYMYIQVNGTYNQLYPNRILPSGYEPYYVKTRTDKNERTITNQFDTPWAGHEGKFSTGISSVTGAATISNVLSAIHAP